jgi:ATP-dependent exoDNAse (exonuclease V) beta subunit
MTAALPPDQPARERIRSDLHTTLFVEAGAGSGKTTALVERVVALVTTGTAELRQIAAITFTEKAGAELRDRVRRVLQEHAVDPASSDEEGERCRRALGQLDGAAIGTLHSFAQRILAEHPVEAQLPPRVEVLDEVTSGIAFDRRWARVLDELLADPALEDTLLLLTAAGVNPSKLRSLALAFDASWDLVEDRVPSSAPPPPSVRQGIASVLREVDTLVALADHCFDPDDTLLDRVHQIAAYGCALRDADGDDLDLFEALVGETPSFKVGNKGKATSWKGCKPQVVDQVAAVAAAVEAAQAVILRSCVHHLGAALRHHTLEAAHARRAAGRLEFHDLLVLARKVLRDPLHGPEVRASLQERYGRLLLDEFQDTDPIQIELAVRIASARPATADEDRWAEVDVAPGRLFVVGDPKQSIYRFRRADISTFLEARERFAPEAGGAVALTANFRTGEPVIHWVNATFAHLMGEPADVEVPVPSQPAFVALDPQRPAAPQGPPVSVLGPSPHPLGTRADALRIAEATDVAHAITAAYLEGWSVRDDTESTGWRRCRLGDITVLVPARTSLPFLEEALEAARIPFRAESSSLVYASRSIRDLLMVLRAADDPTDHLRIVSALRTPLLGCGDDDLFRHKVIDRGTWSYTTPERPDPSRGLVSEGLAFLRDLHEARHWLSPAELLDRIAREGRALELGFAEGRPRDVWRRVRFVVDQARQWSEATGGSLRSYLRWVEQQTVEGARVTESVLPETDDDAVRIMTIHAAKGLEFPITIVSGLSTGASTRRNAVDVVFPRDGGPVGYRLGKDVITEEFEAWKPVDEQMGYDERIRLLYVACTRACDHLVVSLHRPERRTTPGRSTRTNAELLVDGTGEERLAALPDLGGLAVPLPGDPTPAPSPPPDFDGWLATRDAALAVASRPGAVAATALTEEGEPDLGAEPAPAPVHPSGLEDEPHLLPEPDPGLQKRARDLDLPPWLKGRYGTSVGRAVHAVLQTIDLATGAGVDDAVAAQCQAEAVPERSDDVRSLVQAALSSAVVRAAAAAPHWREVYVCTPVGDRLLEGYVDLLYRAADGLVVVDHKTAATADPEELARRVAGYRLQGAAYALTVAATTGEPVARVTFLFLTPDGAIERDLADLPAAIAEVERLVAAGDELVTA